MRNPFRLFLISRTDTPVRMADILNFEATYSRTN